MTNSSALSPHVTRVGDCNDGFGSRGTLVEVKRIFSTARSRMGLWTRYEFDAPYIADEASVLENGIDFFVKQLEEADDGSVARLLSLQVFSNAVTAIRTGGVASCSRAEKSISKVVVWVRRLIFSKDAIA